MNKKVKKHVGVRCLKDPYRVRKPQLREPEEEAADSKVYQCLDTPKLEKVGRVWMQNYQEFQIKWQKIRIRVRYFSPNRLLEFFQELKWILRKREMNFKIFDCA